MKARERQATSTGGSNPQLSLKSDEAGKGRTDEVIAQKLGIGGKDTYRKEKSIVNVIRNSVSELVTIKAKLDYPILLINSIEQGRFPKGICLLFSFMES